MVKEIRNTTLRHLDWEEHKALIEAAQLIEKAFKKKIYLLQVTADKANLDDVHGVMIGFDKYH